MNSFQRTLHMHGHCHSNADNPHLSAPILSQIFVQLLLLKGWTPAPAAYQLLQGVQQGGGCPSCRSQNLPL